MTDDSDRVSGWTVFALAFLVSAVLLFSGACLLPVGEPMTVWRDYERGLALPTTGRKPPLPRPQESDDLFAAPVLATLTREIRGMVRGDSPIESQRAAVDVRHKAAWIKPAILSALATQGPLNAAELEGRAEFDGLAPSTVRKRLSELYQAKAVAKAGRRDKMALWDVAP
jgi:hypothetical protein